MSTEYEYDENLPYVMESLVQDHEGLIARFARRNDAEHAVKQAFNARVIDTTPKPRVPEKVAELVADLRARARVAVSHEATDALNAAADVLTAVSAERDAATIISEQGKAIRHLLSEQGRLRRAITEARAGLELSAEPDWPGWDVLTGTEGILRAALDKEGNDDE